MLTDNELDAIAESTLAAGYPKDCEILHRELHADPDGICYVANRPMDDTRPAYVGLGGFFVVRSTGEVWHFAASQMAYEGLDYWLREYAEGWRPGYYQLHVRHISAPRRLADAIVGTGASYILRDLTHGVVWELRTRYDIDLVLERLQHLPCTFLLTHTEVRFLRQILADSAYADVEYSHFGDLPQWDWRPENNKPEDLDPWHG